MDRYRRAVRAGTALRHLFPPERPALNSVDESAVPVYDPLHYRLMETEITAARHETAVMADKLGHRPEVLVVQIHPDLTVRHSGLEAISYEGQHLIRCRASDAQTEIIDLA